MEKIPAKEISSQDWCRILGHALSRIKPRLKYVAGFKTLKRLLNGPESELRFCNTKFATADQAMPDLTGTGLNERTRFAFLQKMKCPEDSSPQKCYEKCVFLLLTDAGQFAILMLAYYKKGQHNVVFKSFLTSDGLMESSRLEESVIRGHINNGSISPYGVLDTLYLLFYHTIADQEKRTNSMRVERDMLKEMLDRITIS